MHPWEIVDEFEWVVAEYAGASYGVAVDSCTNALFLSLLLYKYKHGVGYVVLPCKTYVGVAHAVINAGHRIVFQDYYWTGVYTIGNTQIVDSARRFRKDMYRAGTCWCVSFHWWKHLPIGRGGMILLDNKEDWLRLRKMRYDGRTERVLPTEDTFDEPGYHCVMHPDDAAKGLVYMAHVPKYLDDLPWDNYADLSKHKYFTGANR